MAPWKLRSEQERLTLHEDYGLEPSLISFKLHYNGVFTNPPGRTYKNGSVTFVDGIICDEFCIHDIDDIMDELGYLGKSDMWYHYLKPGHDLDRGLMDLGCDADVHLLFKYVPEHRLVELFIQHGNNSLQVMESIRPNKEREKGIVIIDDLEEHSLIENVAGHSFMELMLVDEGHNEEEEDNEPLIDPHFLHEEIDINMDGYDDKVQFVCEVESEDEVQVEGEEEGEVGRDEEVPAGKPLGFSDEESNSDSDFETSRNREIRNICKEHERETIPDMVNFYIGQAFGGKQEVKDMISELSIQSRRQLTLAKNDKHRTRVVCKGKMRKYEDDKSGLWDPKLLSESSDVCPWVLHVSCTNNENTWRVKTYVDKHTCVQTREVKLCTRGYLSKHLSETVVVNPNMKICDVQHQLKSKLKLQVTKWQAFRAKGIAVKKLRGDFKQQYAGLRAYILELQRTNENTTVKLDVHVPPDPSVNTRQFRRIYICLGMLKKGFKACKRELLGLDGAFMKGPYPGQILAAVGVDPNNGIYPLAYAVVEAESKDSWTWFLENLGEDLGLTQMSNFTFISDKQKGILPALEHLFPNAEHRYCLRHIHENMKKSWNGKIYKVHLWNCATATTVPFFERGMEALKKYNEEAYNWLKEIAPSHWSRSYFSGRSHCEALLSNMCEVFNHQLVDGRDKPIISCLEYIREYLMRRIAIQQKVIQKTTGPLTPTATKIFEVIKKEAEDYIVTWNGGKKYEVKGPWQDHCVVDMTAKVCTCRRWELTGIPCKHAVAVMFYMSLNGEAVGVPESWVHSCYWLRTWKEVYSFKIEPLQGSLDWPKSDCPTTLTPPPHHTPVGRPSKKRKRAIDEIRVPLVAGHKIRRVGKTVTCSKCKQRGHNSRTCKA